MTNIENSSIGRRIQSKQNGHKIAQRDTIKADAIKKKKAIGE